MSLGCMASPQTDPPVQAGQVYGTILEKNKTNHDANQNQTKNEDDETRVLNERDIVEQEVHSITTKAASRSPQETSKFENKSNGVGS